MRRVIRDKIHAISRPPLVNNALTAEASQKNAKEGKVFTLRQIAAQLQISHEQVRRMFRYEPGIIRLGSVYRMPESVLDRVLTRLVVQ